MTDMKNTELGRRSFLKKLGLRLRHTGTTASLSWC